MKEQIKEIHEKALSEINKLADIAGLNEMRIKYLGKKSEFMQILRGLGSLAEEERPKIGNLVNEIKNDLEQKIKEKEAEIKMQEMKESLEKETLDVTMPSRRGAIRNNTSNNTNNRRGKRYFFRLGV